MSYIIIIWLLVHTWCACTNMHKEVYLRSLSSQTHPNIDKRLFNEQSILGLKGEGRGFPLGQDIGVLKWRLQTTDDSLLPLFSKEMNRCTHSPLFKKHIIHFSSSFSSSSFSFSSSSSSVNCWPSENAGTCDVNVEYELLQEYLHLGDVVISIPLP